MLERARALRPSDPGPRRSEAKPRIEVVRAPREEATTLALHLAIVAAAYRLDVLTLVDEDGIAIASVGDSAAALELAAIAASVVRAGARRASILPRRGVLLESIASGARRYAIAATGIDAAAEAHAIAEAVAEALPAAVALKAEDDDDLEASLEAFFAEPDDDLFDEEFTPSGVVTIAR